MTNLTYLDDSSFSSSILEDYIEKASKVFVLVDTNTLEHAWPLVAATKGLDQAEIVEVEPGEDSKSLDICHQLWASLLDSGADRKSLLINLGGGVVTDLGGFVASTFKRGIKFINIPTSLLAMVDASAGGKTGVNLGHSKNQIGVFNDAALVVIYPVFLKSLPNEHVRSGFAEMLKHGLIKDDNYWRKLIAITNLSAENIAPLIKKSIEIKSEVVLGDPLEMGLRKILNFGHTFGHAIESELWKKNTPILHGHAVALGMVLASEISFLKGRLSKADNQRIQLELSKKFSLTPMLNLVFEELVEELKNDKKNDQGQINFTLLQAIGEAVHDQQCSLIELKNAFVTVQRFAQNNELLAN